MSRASLRVRATGVLVAAVGFWVFALGITALLVWGGWAIVTYAPEYAAAGFLSWVLAGMVAFGFMPRIGWSPDRDTAPGLGATEHPRLHAFVRDVAERAGGPAPDRLYLFHDANAFAGSRRVRTLAKRESVVGIGLPLLAVLTESEARSVLAHEMGHHVAGDVKLGPWVHRTRMAIARAADRLEGSSFWLHLPFVAYAELFLKVSMRVSRAQEIAADALAAKTAGPAVTASALRKSDVIGSAWGTYFHSEVVPVLGRGRLPPLLEGWERYWRASQKPDTPAFEALEGTLKASQYVAERDTHPPLAERIAALGDPAPLSDYAPPALQLLDDVGAAESDVLRALMKDGCKLQPVAWDRVTEEVWLPLWREVVAQHERALRLNIQQIPQALANWESIATATRRGPSAASPEAERRRVARLLATWFTVALASRGWQIDAPPGESVTATKDGKKLEPFAVVLDAAKTPYAEAWARMCGENQL